MKNSTLNILLLSLLLFVVGTCNGYSIEYDWVINESGTYTLEEDLIISEYKYGILINASNVTINGNNFKLIGHNNHDNIGILINYDWMTDKIYGDIEIKNLNISNFSSGIYMEEAKRVSIHNCEFWNNTHVIIVRGSPELYTYLNTFGPNQSSRVNSDPLCSPKAVYEYKGKEHTYRLGNYYIPALDLKDTDNDGVLNGVMLSNEWDGYDPYPLKEAPSNYVIKELYYPTVENLPSYANPVIVDIFALADEPEYYMGKVRPEPTSEPEPTPNGGSGKGTVVKEQEKQGTREGFGSQNIRDRVTLSNVIADDPLDADLARKQLKDNVIGSEDDMSLNEDAVIIGGPVSNAFANKYNHMFEKPVTNDYPGENTGVIQVLRIQEEAGGIVQTHYIVYIAGSDRYGTQAAVEYFKTLTELPDEPILVKWVDGKPVLVE
ncbi:hypothetical protein J3E07_001410 [Methanococcus voltae]|uniref:S-layer protein outer domain-containing protein n=1 Tax=Methanococcus voltae TaxID=2188 RepID=A0A8J7RIA2_METVO|nr:hypothetical protein [Methanococcus voltae]MBP2201970.1 hypothetical protein [Methanococcus voltae]